MFDDVFLFSIIISPDILKKTVSELSWNKYFLQQMER